MGNQIRCLPKYFLLGKTDPLKTSKKLKKNLCSGQSNFGKLQTKLISMSSKRSFST